MFFMHLPYADIAMWALSTPVVLWFGRDFHINAWKQLRHGTANMDTLVSNSTLIAYLFSLFNMLFPDFWLQRGIVPHVYFEASCVIIAFILLGRLLEERAKGNTSSAIRKLMGLQPATVTVVEADGSSHEVPVGHIRIGQVLAVKPGEKIAVDGIVTEGSSYVDESMLSGEPVPVHKEQGTRYSAGTLNQKGAFRFRAEQVGENTMLARIIELVREAQGSKAHIQKITDKIARNLRAGHHLHRPVSVHPVVDTRTGKRVHPRTVSLGHGTDYRLSVRLRPCHPHSHHGGHRERGRARHPD